ncbi:serine/threonine-protein kinase [Streptomyces sp. NPDC001678]|uniref:serine/threonine-protein kinase n=1 Tax=Streptomyces sp. NPDC001678 TaxID=3364599 RepID=UPI0036871927
MAQSHLVEALRAQDPANIGVHTVLARLGAGGMGQVYLGRSPGGRQVAIKVIREDFAESPEALARFRREVETVRAVRSAYTANLIDASLETTPYWLATEYVPGPTLVEAVRARGPLPADTCLRLFAALAEALSHVHAHEVLHRDLKPHNIILSAVGPKLIDFGIARGAEQTALTQAGTAPGTPGYTAPEIITRNDVSPAADVFALGATMAAVATGRPPYGEGPLESVTYRVVHGEVDVAGVEPALAELIRDCVAGDPGKRPDPARIIARCAVSSALVDDPVYRELTAVGGGTPAPSAAYVPTLVPGAPVAAVPTAPAPRPRTKLWLTVGAASVALGVVAALAVQSLGDDAKGGDDKALGKGKGTAKPAASSAASPASSPAASGSPSGPSGAPAPDTGGGSGSGNGKEPAYVEATNPNRDYWTAKEGALYGEGTCNLPSEERVDGQFQSSVSDAVNPEVRVMSGKVKITFRFKYASPDRIKSPFYVSVAVKPPHEIDSSTGKPLSGLRQNNLGLGYTSKPVDIAPKDPGGWGADFKELTYPDDFQQYVNGKPYAQPIPVSNDPGDWTVLFEHVRSEKEYASIGCYGFTAK